MGKAPTFPGLSTSTRKKSKSTPEGNGVWQSKERLLKVTRGANDGMWDWDLIKNKLHYSSRWFEMLGYEPGELPSTPALWRSLIHPEDAKSTDQFLSKVLHNGSETYELEFRLRHKSGRYVPVLSRGFITRDRHQNPIRISGTNSDLSVLKQNEQKLRKTSLQLSKSEKKFRTFFQFSPIPLCHLEVGNDASSKKILLINQAFYDLFGYASADIPTMEEWARRAYPVPTYRNRVLKLWDRDVAKAIASNGSIPGREYRVRCKSGKEVMVKISAIFLADSLLVTFIDLTQQKQAEQILRKREQDLRIILNNVPLPVCYAILGGNSKIKFFNSEFFKCFGYSLQEIPTIGKWFELAYPDAAYRAECINRWNIEMQRAVAGDGIVDAGEYKVTCKDGQVRDLVISAVILGKRIVGSFRDVTERKRNEEKLRQARSREKALKEKQIISLQKKLQTSVVAAAVAHEINQPLSEILLKTQLALEETQAGSRQHHGDKLPHLLEGIVSDSRRVKQTIEKMRALLRNVPISLNPVSPRNVLDSSILYLKPRIKQECVKIEIIDSHRTPDIHGDSQQLQLAISNLLRNSLDAVAAKPPAERFIRVEITSSISHVEIIIGDSGPGISPKIQAGIFQILTSDKPKGTGIGLYLARTAMTNHGGSIRHGSSSLGGAEFRLRFPLTNRQPGRTRTNKKIPLKS
jgi:PAS domain S-box-containing protein